MVNNKIVDAHVRILQPDFCCLILPTDWQKTILKWSYTLKKKEIKRNSRNKNKTDLDYSILF